jgi:hypothetical protein
MNPALKPLVLFLTLVDRKRFRAVPLRSADGNRQLASTGPTVVFSGADGAAAMVIGPGDGDGSIPTSRCSRRTRGDRSAR